MAVLDTPAVSTNPLLGEALALKHDFLATIERARAVHGDVVHIPVGPKPLGRSLLAVFHPDGVQQVLSGDRGAFHKDTPVNKEMRASLGDGLLTSEGDRWVAQRRIMQPLFTRPKVRTFTDLMVEAAADAADRWAASDEPVDLGREMTAYATVVVGRAIFGSDLTDLVDVFTDHVPTVNALTLKRAFNPIPLPRSVPTRENRRLNAASAEVERVVDLLIEGRIRTGERQDDLVSMLLDATDPETGDSLSPTEIRDQVLVTLAAGHDTTATAMAFALFLLGHNPDWQERAHAHVDEVLGDRAADAGDERNLDLVERIAKEAMRLYPSAYVTGRIAVHDTEILGHPVKAGQEVIVSPWVTQRHPDLWDDPTTFDPDRFLPEADKARHRYAWFPFGGGPRLCVGIHFSMLEQVLGLATILQRVELRSLVDDVDLETGITLIPSSPVLAEVTAR